MTSLPRCTSVLLLLSHIGSAVDRNCPFINSLNEEHCLKATGGDSVSFEFKPLFPENPTFVHGFETASLDDLRDYPSLSSVTGLFVKVGFWLEYGESKLDDGAGRLTDFSALYYNTTKDVGGGNNGCDGPFGESCMKALKKGLKSQIPSTISELDGQGLLPAPYLEEALDTVEVGDEPVVIKVIT